MSGRVLVAVLIAAGLVMPAVAAADDVVAYQAEGDAPSGGADPRVAALDEAFARAVNAALADVVAADVRTANKGQLDKEIVGHARLWVVKFTVTKDETNDDRRELAVAVRIDRDKVRARLGELGIAVKEAGAVPTPDGQPARPATIVVRIAAPSGVRANYGAAAEKDVPGLAALTGLLRGAGMAVRKAPASGPADKPELSDEDAAALADAAKADVVLIAGVTVGAPVPVRGQPVAAALVTAKVRLLDRKDGKAAAEGTALSAARGDETAYAIDHALLAAASDVLPAGPRKLEKAGAFHGDDAPVAEAGVILVRLGSKTPLGMVLAEQKYLAGAKGVRAASLRRLSPGGWVIGVATGESIEKVAQIAKKPPATDTSSSVKIVGDIVEVALSGSP